MRVIDVRILVACAIGAGLASAGCNALPTGLPGAWSGHVELLQFASGSDAIAMSIASASTTSVTGKVLFDGGPLLAPATDPKVVYPPVDPNTANSTSAQVEGFEYTIAEGSFTGSELTLSVDSFELWTAWCKLQTPVAMTRPGPAGGTVADGFWCGPAGLMPNPTNAQALCSDVCACTQTACAAQPLSVSPIAFDLTLSGDQLSGSVLGLTQQGETRTVIMTKQ